MQFLSLDPWFDQCVDLRKIGSDDVHFLKILSGAVGLIEIGRAHV